MQIVWHVLKMRLFASPPVRIGGVLRAECRQAAWLLGRILACSVSVSMLVWQQGKQLSWCCFFLFYWVSIGSQLYDDVRACVCV